jgi:hypothetical protein
MRLFTKRPASERLVTFLKKDCGAFKREIDVDHFLARIEQAGTLVATSEFLRQAEAKKLMLPPGYWRYLYRLEQELKQHE